MEGGRLEGAGALSPKRYETVVFDLDGTLVAIPVEWRAARGEVASVLGGGLDGAPLFPSIRSQTEGKPALRERIFAVLDRYEIEASDTVKPFEGADDALRFLARDRRLALVTMQGRSACTRVLGRLGWTGLFGRVLTREDSLDRAEQILKAMAALGSRREDSILVADKVSDAEAARACGIAVAIVGRDSAGSPPPDYLLPGVSSLLSVIA